MTNKKFKHKYHTTKILVEENKTISDVIHIIYENDNHIRINYKIVGNHYSIFPTTRNKKPVKIKITNRIKDKEKENKIREIMSADKNISTKKLRELTGFGMDTINRYYMIVRRENSLKKYKY